MKNRIAKIAINLFAALILCHGVMAVDYSDGARRAVTLWWDISNNTGACDRRAFLALLRSELQQSSIA